MYIQSVLWSCFVCGAGGVVVTSVIGLVLNRNTSTSTSNLVRAGTGTLLL